MKQLFLIFTLCALPFLVLPQDTTFTSEPIETGFVFIDGKYIEPPYVVEVKDKSILINKIKATEIINSDEKFKFSISSLPEIPNSLNKESSFEDIFKAINPITKRLYINEIFVYAYTNFNFNDALKVQLNYYKNLPNVKSIERKPDSNTWWVIETFDGKKNKAIIGGPEAEYFYKNYGQESDNLKIDKLLVLKTITAAKNIKQKLKESDLVFLFSNELYNYNLPKDRKSVV